MSTLTQTGGLSKFVGCVLNGASTLKHFILNFLLKRLRRIFVRYSGIGQLSDYSTLLLQFQKHVRQTINNYQTDLSGGPLPAPALLQCIFGLFEIELLEAAIQLQKEIKWQLSDPTRFRSDLGQLREKGATDFRRMVEVLAIRDRIDNPGISTGPSPENAEILNVDIFHPFSKCHGSTIS